MFFPFLLIRYRLYEVKLYNRCYAVLHLVCVLYENKVYLVPIRGFL